MCAVFALIQILIMRKFCKTALHVLVFSAAIPIALACKTVVQDLINFRGAPLSIILRPFWENVFVGCLPFLATGLLVVIDVNRPEGSETKLRRG